MTSDLCLFPESNPHVTPPTILGGPIFKNTNTNHDDFVLVPSVELTHYTTNKDEYRHGKRNNYFLARLTAKLMNIRMTVIYPPWPISIKASRILDIANILENIVDQSSNCCCWYLLVDALNGAP